MREMWEGKGKERRKKVKLIAIVRKCEQLKVITDASAVRLAIKNFSVHSATCFKTWENYSEFPSRFIVNVILAHMSMCGCCMTA